MTRPSPIDNNPADPSRILTGPLFPEPEPSAAPEHRPARIARLLAEAHHIQQAIQHNKYTNQAEAARRLGLTRSRVTQLLSLTFLAPDIQDDLLQLKAVNQKEPVTEREVRDLCRHVFWAKQRALWQDLKSTRDNI